VVPICVMHLGNNLQIFSKQKQVETMLQKSSGLPRLTGKKILPLRQNGEEEEYTPSGSETLVCNKTTSLKKKIKKTEAPK